MTTPADIIDQPGASATLPVFFRNYVPPRPLSDKVATFWYWQGHDVPYSKERVLPMGTVDLVFQLGSPRPSDSGISGPRSQSLVIERRGHDRLLGIHFKAGGAFPFLGFPPAELHNLGINLAELWGEQRARRLLSLLHDAPTVQMQFQVLERWLMQMADRPLKQHAAVRFAMQEFYCHPNRSSAEIAEEVGLSQRRFIELFRNEVGLTPKLFGRIQRFRGTILTIQNRTAVDWVDVALSCGYFDQAHFIHDFQEFSGLTPGEYLKLRTPHPNHVQFRD